MRQPISPSCCVCGTWIKPTICLNPTCSRECSKERKRQRMAAYRETNHDRLLAYDRAYQRNKLANETPRQKAQRKHKAREWRNEKGRTKLLAAKKRYRESAKGRATTRAYVTKNAARIRAYYSDRKDHYRELSRKWAAANRRRDPNYRRKLAIKHLHKTPNHIKHRKTIYRDRAIQNYYVNREEILAVMRGYDSTDKRREQIRTRRRLGAAAYRFLVGIGVMRIVRGDATLRRRMHTVALHTVRKAGMLNNMEIAS